MIAKTRRSRVTAQLFVIGHPAAYASLPSAAEAEGATSIYKIIKSKRTRARYRVRASNLSTICNILPSFCAELNAVQSA